jgi:hypothetical protein
MRSARAIGTSIASVSAVVACCLAGCGSFEETGGHEVAAHPPTPGRHADVRVGLTEWTIVASRSQVRPGRVSILVTNAGATVHDLVVRDRSGTWETPDLHPGEQVRLVVRAAPHDILQLWCSMPGHRAQGMHTTLSSS